MNEASSTTMSSTNDGVLEKADALIKRRRVFLAGSRHLLAEPTATGDIDLPVLTEVVEPGTPTANAEVVALAQRDAQWRAVIEQELSQWLDEALPDITLSLLDDLADRLVSRIDEHIRQQLLPRLLAQLDSPTSAGADQGPATLL